MKKLPRLPEHPTLDEAAEWLTEASDEAWSPSAVLSRLLEWERPEVLSDGTVRQSRVATSREVWVVVPPGEVMTDQVDGAEVVTRGGQLAYILEPIDLFVSTVLHCGEAVPNNGVSTQAGRRFHVTRSFSVRDVRIPKNDVFELLPAFDQLMFELDRGEHSDLARLVDDGAHGSVVSPTTLNQSAGEQEGQGDTGYLLAPTTSRVLTERPARAGAEPLPREVLQAEAGVRTDGRVAWQAVMLESWQEIMKAREGKPTALNAVQWIKDHGPRDVIPAEQPNRWSLRWIDSDGGLQTVQYKSVATRISEWRKAGLIPA